MKITSRTVALLAAVVAACSVLGACGGAASSGSSTSAGGAAAPGSSTTANGAVVVGTSPSVSNVSLYYAMNSGGLFSKAGLQVKTQEITSGAQAVPLLLNGQLQFTAADPMGVLTAMSQGVPLEFVAQSNVAPKDAALDPSGIIVSAGSGIHSVSQLEGKTVGLIALQGLPLIMAEAGIDARGGDASKVKFVSVPMTSMIDAVKRGVVNAAVVNEPYVTQAIAEGMTVLSHPFADGLPGVASLVYVTSRNFAQSHPDIVSKFATAIEQSNEDMSKSPNLIRETAKSSTSIPESLLSKMILPVFNGQQLSESELQSVMQIMLKYGALKKPVDLSNAIFTPGN